MLVSVVKEQIARAKRAKRNKGGRRVKYDYELELASSIMRVTKSDLRVTSSNLRVTIPNPQVRLQNAQLVTLMRSGGWENIGI